MILWSRFMAWLFARDRYLFIFAYGLTISVITVLIVCAIYIELMIQGVK